MGQANPPTVTCTPPMEVETLPEESSVRPAGGAGPMGCAGSLAKRVMISPGATPAAEELAALVTLVMAGSGPVAFQVTFMLVASATPPEPDTSMVSGEGAGEGAVVCQE